jgi:hypothetical protein
MAGPRVLIEKQETVSYTRMYMVCVTEHVWKDIYKYGRTASCDGESETEPGWRRAWSGRTRRARAPKYCWTKQICAYQNLPCVVLPYVSA